MSSSIVITENIKLSKLDLLCIKMQQREKEKKQQLYNVLELNKEGVITNFNSTLLNITGLNLDDIEGVHFSKFIKASSINIEWEKIITGTILSDEFIFQNDRNDSRRLKGYFEPVCSDGSSTPYKVILKVAFP